MSSASTDLSSCNERVQIKVLILGDRGVGKTLAARQFMGNTCEIISQGILRKSVRVNDKLYELNVFDTVSFEEFGEVPPEYKDVDKCLLMYSASDLSSFINLTYWISKFKKEANIKNADTFPFVVVGNKQDVPDYARLISRKEADDWCWNNNLCHPEISTKEEPTINRIFGVGMALYERRQEELGQSSGTINRILIPNVIIRKMTWCRHFKN
ncbi:PREDICTED: ras-related protein RABG3d-like [Dinoponera quadriceps]|uniref:Ras-related protein RABG3d-like n=1 Tax=Dinoponera quadriceps TaxID=609295 RepID=A0A6P3Y5W0_DINQU|nr:PREDICTED: ras-related protein RABG3d-like [Dinoponera quadriceps]